MIEYKPWTVAKIQGSMTNELDKRVNNLIGLRENLINSIQVEIDFIYCEVERRAKVNSSAAVEVKANNSEADPRD